MRRLVEMTSLTSIFYNLKLPLSLQAARTEHAYLQVVQQTADAQAI